MAQVKGDGSTRQATAASKARNVSQNTENLYNAALVNWAFEDASIAASKIIGGIPGTPAISYDTTFTTSLVSTNAIASTFRAIAIGQSGTTAGSRAVAIGYGASATQEGSIAIGRGSVAYGAQDVAIGNNAYAKTGFIGRVLIGEGSYSGATETVSVGGDSYVGGSRGVAVGHEASVFAGSSNGIAIGFRADVKAGITNAISIGTQARTYADEALAIGYYAYVLGSLSTRSIAIGTSTVVFDDNPNTIIIGSVSQTDAVGGTAENSTVIGVSTIGIKANAVHIGYNNTGGGDFSITMGANAAGVGNYGMAIGTSANANQTREHIIGHQVPGAGVSTFSLGVSATEHITFDTWTAAASVKSITHQLPIQVAGSTYYVLLST
jgi:hypothetical protein